VAVISGAAIAYHSGEPEFTRGFITLLSSSESFFFS